MPDRRRHRGPHPADAELFSTEARGRLNEAVRDLSWLLTRDYSSNAALKLVGDRYQLADRQRIAVMRCACADDSLNERRRRQVDAAAVCGRSVVIDGFNLLTTIEAALAGGVLIRGRDGCLRDMASMHGTYRQVNETWPALIQIGRRLVHYGVKQVHWLLDRPVSNSGRLAVSLRAIAKDHKWPWTAELDDNPDRRLMEIQDAVIVSADSYVIEHSAAWWLLADDVVNHCRADCRILDLAGE